MAYAYFDSDAFLSVLAKEPSAPQVRAVLAELKADKVRIYTSILTVQEVSVSSFSHGGAFQDFHSKVSRLARIKSVTKDIALTAAKFEAVILDQIKKNQPRSEAEKQAKAIENKRRKFDCFHLATAVVLGCSRFYAFDGKYQSRVATLGLMIQVVRPAPMKPKLPFMAIESDAHPRL